MRIGIDLDNTIIFYDDAFVKAALERKLLPAGFKGTKQQLRDALRKQQDGEIEWQKLQGYVYGQGLSYASMFPGVDAFFQDARDHELFIVSHKTEFGHYDPARINLRDAARSWLESKGFFKTFGMKPENLFFESTRAEKIATISRLNLDCFIDDLVEVYAEPNFPMQVGKVLFHAAPTPAPEGNWIVCHDWGQIRTIITNKEYVQHLKNSRDGELITAARKLTGDLDVDIINAAGGGNSRIYKVTAKTGTFALKRYPIIKNDSRDRLGVEKKALEYLAAHHFDCVPRWFDSWLHYARMEWVEGRLVTDPTMADIDSAVTFLRRIFDLSKTTSPESMPPASEACLSGNEIVRQAEARLERLQKESDPLLTEFLNDHFLPEMQKRVAAAKSFPYFNTLLPQSERALIPADFGFHNALRTSGGKLLFIDFEYFGWDDPVKLICDFLLHPAMTLSAEMRQRFLSGTLDPALKPRFNALYPLFGLRWALILLNEFIPERWQARSFARGETSWEDVKIRQLDKARRMMTQSARFE